MAIKSLIGALTVLLVLIGLGSCMRPMTPTEKTTITYRDTTFKIPADKVSAILSDSLLNVLRQLRAEGKPAIVEYRNSPDSPTHLSISLDDKGNIQADCSKDAELFKALIKEVQMLREERKVISNTPEWIVWVLAGAVLYLILLPILKGLINLFKPKIL